MYSRFLKIFKACFIPETLLNFCFVKYCSVSCICRLWMPFLIIPVYPVLSTSFQLNTLLHFRFQEALNVFKQQMKLYEQVENFQMMYKVNSLMLDKILAAEAKITFPLQSIMPGVSPTSTPQLHPAAAFSPIFLLS